MRAALGAVALVAACTSSPAEGAVEQATSHLGRVRSATMAMRLVAGAGDRPTGEEVGFTLEGPFALAPPGGLPVARMEYTQLAGKDRTSVEVLSTGRNAYVVTRGRTYTLPAREVDQLRAPKGDGGSEGTFGQLRIQRWFEDPRLSDGGVVDGVPVDRVEGRLRVVDALNDLFGFSRRVGAGEVGGVPRIEGRSAEQLEAAVASADVQMLAGRRDHFIRRLAFHVRLESRAPPAVRQALGRLAAARIDFELTLREPNRPVRVPEPANPLPASALPGR